MELTVWIALVVLFFSGGLTPGPAVMLVTTSSLRYGFAPAMLAGFGVSTANLLWIALAASGAAALASTFPLAFAGLKLIGVCFILWLAWSLASNAEPITVAAKTAPRQSVLFAKGIGLQLANPNALVFFGGLLPAYFDAQKPLMMQVLIVAATVTVTEMVGLAVYAGAAKVLSKRFQHTAFVRVFNITAAVLMAGSAVFAVMTTLR